LIEGDGWDLEGLRVEYYVKEEPGVRVLYENPTIKQRFRTFHEWWVPVTPGKDEIAAFRRLREQVVQHKCCADRLVGHLNCHKEYYNRAIWLAEDPDARAIRFDQLRYRDGTLLDYIDNRPIGILGNFVAFPERGEESPDGERVMDERLVSLPTAGLFAEAQLSHCNACEERDVTRFWDWSESPCPERAPEITGVTPSSRARPLEGIEPSAFPSSVVNIVNPSAAPDPSGMAGVMALLSTSDIFRDMSAGQEVADLLQQLAQGSVSLLEARQRAQSLRNRVSQDGTGGGGGGAPRRPTPREQHDQLQVYRNAEEHGELDTEERRQRGRQYLRRSQPEPAPAPEPTPTTPPEEPPPAEPTRFQSFDIVITEVNLPVGGISIGEGGGEFARGAVRIQGRIRSVNGELSPWYAFTCEGEGEGLVLAVGSPRALRADRVRAERSVRFPDDFNRAPCSFEMGTFGPGSGNGLLRFHIGGVIGAQAEFPIVLPGTLSVLTGFRGIGRIEEIRPLE
jgi:hypothetical protein